MRFIYLDEAGVSAPKHEPYVVVAGVIIDADRQWKDIEQHLHALADLYAPPAHRRKFIFHATELFSGSKKFPREEFSKEARWSILDALIAVPSAFSLPIVFGSIDRITLAKSYPTDTPAKLTNMAQGIAYVVALYQAEYWMKTYADEGEVAAVVMENNRQAKETIASAHDFIQARYSDFLQRYGLEKVGVQHIIETPHFSEKHMHSPLQIADACAFAIKRHRMKTPECARFHDPLIPRLVMRYKSEM
jgi:Protein of unknown function (DUF3800)